MVVVQDRGTRLRAVVAVHSTALGPAVGGLRMRPYATLDDAVRDALRLSYAMSLKNAAAELGLGGGKAVILDDGDVASRSARLLRFADVVASLDGAYITAEDIGTTPADMELLASRTEHVLGRPPEHGGSGDPSPATAATVAEAIAAGVRVRLGRSDLAGVRVAVVGTGKVGGDLARRLCRAGAELVLADLVPGRARALADELGARVASVEDALVAPVDVVSPCATGEMISAGDAGRLQCRVVAGAANNPLVDHAAAVALHEAGVLYVPDFLANCGGMISIAADYRGEGPDRVADGVRRAAARIVALLDDARAAGRPPVEVAEEQALALIRRGVAAGPAPALP